jgi:hypothetical protein
MNLALEKGERVTTGGKGIGKIGGEAGEVTGVVADAPTTDGLGKMYGRIPFPCVCVCLSFCDLFNFCKSFHFPFP